MYSLFINVSFSEIILFGYLFELNFIIFILLILSFNLLYVYHIYIFIRVFLITFLGYINISCKSYSSIICIYASAYIGIPTDIFTLLYFKYNGRSLT